MAETASTTSPSRRTVLAGLSVATASVAAVDILLAARVPGDDPIYAAIKRERDVFAVYCVTGEAQSRVSDQNPSPMTEEEYSAKGAKCEALWAERVAHPEHKAWWAQYKEVAAVHDQSARELWSAREAFLQTQPTTLFP